MTKDDPFAPSQEQAQAAVVDDAKLTELGMTKREIAAWQKLRSRYLNRKPAQWEEMCAPELSFFSDYSKLAEAGSPEDIKKILDKVAVLKLNGGLGIKMGLKGPKSAIPVTPAFTFLDLTVLHVEKLNNTYGCDIPLLLMNSFNTDKETKHILNKYSDHNVSISTFMQSKFPRFYKDTLNPIPKPGQFKPADWYPPGSGDVFSSLEACGLLQQLLDAGKEYIFISNVENLGADLDLKILKHAVDTKAEFFLELTDRITTDISGGILVKYQNKVHVMETSQVPPAKAPKFSVRDYKFWNTNNTWVNLATVRDLLKSNSLELDFVLTNVVTAEGRMEILLETPASMAVPCFAKSAAIHVPRMRYRPVKSTSQLMLAQSDIFEFDSETGEMGMNPRREPPTVPLIKLGDEFASMTEYQKRMPKVPTILELEHLTVSGDVYFGSGITLKGTVIIVANHGERIDLPDGVVLENKIVSGTMRVLEH